MEPVGIFKGTVIKYNVEKGFGFIKILSQLIDGVFEDTQYPMGDAFIHYKGIKEHSNGTGIAKLFVGETVLFTCVEGPKGNSAEKLKVLDISEEHQANHIMEEYDNEHSGNR